MYEAEYVGSGTFRISKPKRKEAKQRQSRLKGQPGALANSFGWTRTARAVLWSVKIFGPSEGFPSVT